MNTPLSVCLPPKLLPMVAEAGIVLELTRLNSSEGIQTVG